MIDVTTGSPYAYHLHKCLGRATGHTDRIRSTRCDRMAPTTYDVPSWVPQPKQRHPLDLTLSSPAGGLAATGLGAAADEAACSELAGFLWSRYCHERPMQQNYTV